MARKKPTRTGGGSRAPIERCMNVLDFEALARKRMKRAFYDYYAGGAEDEDPGSHFGRLRLERSSGGPGVSGGASVDGRQSTVDSAGLTAGFTSPPPLS